MIYAVYLAVEPDQRAGGRGMDLDRRPCHDTGGLQLVVLGMLGEYLWRVVRRVRRAVVSGAGCDRAFPAPRCVNRPVTRICQTARWIAVAQARFFARPTSFSAF